MKALSIKSYPLLSINFVNAYVITMRPYLMFVSGITGILGLSFSSNIGLLNAILIFKVTFLSYGFGQALTDCFQIDTDSISSPYRPLTQGVVNRRQIIIISSLGLLYCISVLAYFNPINLLLGTVAGIGLATYTPFKRKWWAGPFYNSWIVVVLFIMAYLAGLGRININFFNPIFVAAIVTVFFGYANFVLTGYFKDIAADRVTNYNTLPVKFGRKFSCVVSDIFGFLTSASVSLLIILLALDLYPPQALIRSIIFFIVGAGATIYTQMKLHSVIDDASAHKAIVPCVHSYILLLSSLVVLNKPDWFIPIILFYFFYTIVLKIRPAREQI